MPREENVLSLIGDFYQAHTAGNAEARDEALNKIQRLAYSGETDGKPFIEYYNDIFSGRTGFNARINTEDYPKESIIRELFQNAMGCHYISSDIKIVADFKENDTLILSYNEVGFSMEDVLYYFGFGMNNGDTTREGRFGIGAKSVFLNVQSLSVRSNRFSFTIENENGNKLHLSAFDLEAQQFKGTTITLKLDHTEYERIKDNFHTLTEKKGDYLNMVELCFAFNRKKVMNGEDGEAENPKRTLNVAVMENGKPTDIYRVQLYSKDENDTPKIRFYHNNKSLVDFLCYENEGFVYLVPFAVANTKRASVISLLLSKYNYFSTYELTGYIGAGKDNVVDEKLSAFFVSVPNTCVTNSRTGIRFDCEEKVYGALQRDVSTILQEYKKYFILDVVPAQDGESCVLRPRSYAFEFFNSYMKTSRYADKVKDIFISGISLQFPGEAEPAPYDEIKANAFKATSSGVTKEYHDSGEAADELIVKRLEKMKDGLAEGEESAIYSGYEWENEDGTIAGRNYCYEIHRGGKIYKLFPAPDGSPTDYELYTGFSSVLGHYLPTLLVDDCVTDEDALEKIFSLFDEASGENYTLAMKYYRIHYESGGEKYSFEISKIHVNNIKNAIDTVKRREKRFLSHQNYQEVESLMMNSFTQGKDTMSFLRLIREQGGEIGFTLDFNKKYRFLVYGKQFMIPGSITNNDLIEIVGDVNALMESGVMKDRIFDFGYSKSRYSFDVDMVAELLMDYASYKETSDIMNNLYTTNLRFDGVAFLKDDDKVVCVKHFGQPITEDERKAAKKYVILRDDLNKTEFALMVEYIIAGSGLGILSYFFNRIKDPNRIIPDQLPLKYRRTPILSKEEFAYVRELYTSIREESELAGYKNYFAKDINGRLYGYGTCCAFCGESGHDINSYDLMDFSTDVMTEEGERRFTFTMYLCRNHIAASQGWLVKELSIGGMDPFTWLAELSQAESVPPEFFICSLKYEPHMVYDITSDSSSRSADIVSAGVKTLNFRLTPLMAAKWVIDNQK